MEYAYFLAVAATIAIIWAATDRVIYKGPGSVTANEMLHASPTYKTVFVVPHEALKGRLEHSRRRRFERQGGRYREGWFQRSRHRRAPAPLRRDSRDAHLLSACMPG